jgi:hypothetical protein
MTLKVQAYSSSNCEGAQSEATYSMNVCAKSNAIFGTSVSVRCTNDNTVLPLLNDAIVERYLILNLECLVSARSWLHLSTFLCLYKITAHTVLPIKAARVILPVSRHLWNPLVAPINIRGQPNTSHVLIKVKRTWYFTPQIFTIDKLQMLTKSVSFLSSS